jgi:hypothetical protein
MFSGGSNVDVFQALDNRPRVPHAGRLDETWSIAMIFDAPLAE